MKRLVSILVSLALLALIYSRIDVQALGRVLRTCNPFWLVVGLGVLVPIKLVQAWRLRQLMVLPSKMGDIAKAWFMKKRGPLSGSLSLSLVIFEKASDVLALLLWCALGLLFYPDKDRPLWLLMWVVLAMLIGGTLLLASAAFAHLAFGLAGRLAPARFRGKIERLRDAWTETREYFRTERAQLGRVTALSIGLWLIHFLQLWLFILALNTWTPFLLHIALASVAILAGLFPLTFAGLGTRDAALISLYHPWFGPPTAAALGILFTSRYVLPALGGLPFFRRYLEEIRREEGREAA
jgi:uncharacterized protein (TIRG00374 family)